jgi:endonuclease YncB( thermonuclease family)
VCPFDEDVLVVDIENGRTLVVRDEKGGFKRIFLAGIAVDSTSTPNGKAAWTRAASLIKGRKVTPWVLLGHVREAWAARTYEARVELAGSRQDVALVLLKEGLGEFVSTERLGAAEECSYELAEREAQYGRLGKWSLSNTQPN